MIERNLTAALLKAATWYPVVAVTGPRQSGKTTLCRAAFPDKPWVSLEPLDVRAYATEDPRGFLAEYADGAILDEIQQAPQLLGYLQHAVDERPEPGRFVLTGSQQLALSDGVAQSLAGRVAVLRLLPMSFDELSRFEHPPNTLFEALWQGGYPRIYDRGIPPPRWLSDYLATYVQQDVRQLLNVGDLQAFETFLRLCAGRTAQEVNLSKLGADAGITHNTARSWLSVLEASFVMFRTPAWHANTRKQQIKAAKLHFVDTGLACHLLGIRSPEQVRSHPLRGPLFESWVASEVLKTRLHRGLEPALYHYRQTRGLEVDLVVDAGARLIAAGTKSGATPASDWFAGLGELDEVLRGDGRAVDARVVYGGDTAQRRSRGRLIPWRSVPDEDW